MNSRVVIIAILIMIKVIGVVSRVKADDIYFGKLGKTIVIPNLLLLKNAMKIEQQKVLKNLHLNTNKMNCVQNSGMKLKKNTTNIFE